MIVQKSHELSIWYQTVIFFKHSFRDKILANDIMVIGSNR